MKKENRPFRGWFSKPCWYFWDGAAFTWGVCDENSSGNFGPAGTNGTVYALAADGQGNLLGGAFSEAGGVAANNVARWNNGWSALGIR